MLRSGKLLEAATRSMPDIGIRRQREAYVVYIDLLTKLGLFSAASELLKSSQDEYIKDLNKKGVNIHITCARCGKEVMDSDRSAASSAGCATASSWCARCRQCVGTCSLCALPVTGLFFWCPICSHGGHKSCIKKWFRLHTTCASGCGHTCVLVAPDIVKKQT